jgi:hypothetical protein
VLRVFARFLRPSQPYTISLAPFSKAFMRLPAVLFGLLSPRMCDSVLLIRAARWPLSGSDARPRLNSTTTLLSNMTMLEVGTICNKTSVMVRHFTQSDERGRILFQRLCAWGLTVLLLS